ncbi:MAG: hypothetical protein GXY22_06190 [Clostridiaceae bacterium]|jgi:hypothetical protein|nr:hypothetical protein [Clostridiaceae bacterium]
MGDMIELRTELDKLISRLSGVLAARTVLNEQDEIVEIHVLSDMTKSPKQLVRDIQSAAMSVYGIDIDYKLISIAQVNSNMVIPASQQENRLQIHRITVSLDNISVETTVTLEQGENQFVGTSRTPLASRNRIQSAVQACLEAIRQYLGPAYNMTLLDLQRHPVAGTDCVIISLMYTDPFRESVLYGIAGINSPDTEVQSAVMAVLSALNRPIGKSGRAT